MFLQEAPLDLAALTRGITRDEHGACCTFVGLVRNHHGGRTVTRLAYSAYVPMAEAECARIVAEAEARWPAKVALAHRLGLVPIGEAAVAIAAVSSHREAAFTACRFVIEEVKARVPIWKRETYADGTEVWVDPSGISAPTGPAAP